MRPLVVNILPFLLMFGLIASNFVDESQPLNIQKINGKQGHTQHESGQHNITEEDIQFVAGIRKGKAQNVWFGNPLPDCYKRFFVRERPPSGLRAGPDNLQGIRYICQLDENRPFYSTMFDEKNGIAVFSAYTLTPRRTRFPRSRPSLPWSRTEGIKLQGTDDIYQAPYDKAHLAPAMTLGSSFSSIRSTFQYTNAVPLTSNFHRGLWKRLEGMIRRYALKCTGEGSTLFLMTGTSFALIPRGFPRETLEHPAVIKQLGHGENAIRIPLSMWTAGCCVSEKWSWRTRGFAVIGNNVDLHDPGNRRKYSSARQVPVKVLQKLLGDDASFRGIGSQTVNLFPGNSECSRRDLGSLARAIGGPRG